MTIKVAVIGATGRMGKLALDIIKGSSDLALHAALDSKSELAQALGADVIFEATNLEVSKSVVDFAIQNNMKVLVATSGWTESALAEVSTKLSGSGAVVVVPNFSVGSALATKFAAEVVSNSHGSYDGFNTPRVLTSDVGRVVGQFKRFQIIQLSMLAKVIHATFKGASAEEKMVARRTLAFITGHMAVLGGALGVPFVMQMGNLITNLFGDDDEPKDFEYKLRQAIGDKALADLLLNGVPAAMGVNLGGKLGLGAVASVLPFTDVDLTSRSGYEKVLVGLLGPFLGGLAPKFADGAGMIGKGEYYKGLELLMPNGIGNAMKGVRYANEGITMRNGDVVMKPEDISIVDAAFQAVGLPTTTITSRQYIQNTKFEFDKFYTAKAADIKSAYVDANRDGDTAAMADARKDWEDLQASRRKNGYKIQPMSELFMAVSAARKRQASVVNGVETTKSNKQFVANII
jgi:hypothetical protein